MFDQNVGTGTLAPWRDPDLVDLVIATFCPHVDFEHGRPKAQQMPGLVRVGVALHRT